MGTVEGLAREVAARLEGLLDEVDDAEFRIEFTAPDGFRPAISLRLDEDAAERPWLVARCSLGDLDDLDPAEVLERNAVPSYAFTATHGGKGYVYARLPAARVDVDTCRQMMLDVAEAASALERARTPEVD